MAPFSNFISLLFLTTLLLSLQIHARDSQFFGKVTHVNHNNNNNNVKETELPNNEGPVNKPEQQPVFTPETENSYGLYGHETGMHPPTTTTTTTAAPYTTTPTNASPYTTTTTTYQPYKTESEDTKFHNNNYNNYNKDAYNTNQNELSDTRLAGTSYSYDNNNNNNYYKDAYGGKENELSDTKYAEGGYNTMANQNNNQKYYYNNNAANDRYNYNNNNAANNKYNGERQGMSDTRYVEGGKYFYDFNSEKYDPTLNGGSSRGVNSENWSNNRGYFGNNFANSYENKNSMEGYQNQKVFEDDQDDFEP